MNLNLDQYKENIKREMDYKLEDFKSRTRDKIDQEFDQIKREMQQEMENLKKQIKQQK